MEKLIDIESVYLILETAKEEIAAASQFEIIRCGECAFWNGETHGCVRNPSVEPWWESDYCSYGERRSDGREL